MCRVFDAILTTVDMWSCSLRTYPTLVQELAHNVLSLKHVAP